MLNRLYTILLNSMNDIKIRNKILIFVCTSIIFFVILISYFTFIKVESIVNKESGDSMMAILAQINNNIDYNIKKFEVSINSFYSGGKIKSLITTNPNMFGNKLSYLREIKRQIFTFKSINDSVTDLRIFTFNKDYVWNDTSIYDIDEIRHYQWFESLMANKESDHFYWTNAGDGTWNKFSYISTIYCYKAVFNDVSYKPLAVLRTDIASENVFEAINSVRFGKYGTVFVAKENGNLIFFNKDSKINLGNFKSKIAKVAAREEIEGSFIADIDGVNEFLVYSKRNKLGWYIIGSIPQSELKEKADSIRNFITVLSLVVCIFALIVAFLFSSLLTRRMTKMSKAIYKFGMGNFDVDVRVYGNDEIGQVAYQFRNMMKRMKELVIEVEEQHKREKELLNEKYELEILKKEAELCALQNQINPHFLYNTLEMIKGLLFSEDPNRNIINATQALSDTFKYNLNSGYVVKVKDEIEHVENYLTIQNMRFDKTIRLIVDVDENGLNCNIVRFTFEPIIENAIKHGFSKTRSDYQIRISSKVTNDKLVIFIEDNGIGIDKDRLIQIKDLLLKDEYSFKSKITGGLGIYNVNERIKRHFGNDYGIDITSTRNKGTIVLIYLPINL